LRADWNKEEFGNKDSAVRRKCQQELEEVLHLPTKFDGDFFWDWVFKRSKKSGVNRDAASPGASSSMMDISNLVGTLQ
jgi:hypothetical protein